MEFPTLLWIFQIVFERSIDARFEFDFINVINSLQNALLQKAGLKCYNYKVSAHKDDKNWNLYVWAEKVHHLYLERHSRVKKAR